MLSDIFAYHGDPQAATAVRDGQQTRPQRKGATAIVHIQGSLDREGTRGTSTEVAAELIKSAAADSAVDRILLRVNSPGGKVAGTSDLVDTIARARDKPILAYVQDQGTSAAYWIASQAKHIWANRTAIVGGIGIYSAIADASEMFNRMGVKVVTIRTGAHKGVGTFGTSISDEQQVELQRVVDSLNEQFLTGVSAGRRMSIDKVRELADGRVWTAPEAMKLGLIDGIGSFDDVLNLGTANADLKPLSAKDRFDAAVLAKVEGGADHQAAVRSVVAEQPDLQAAMHSEANPDRPRGTRSRSDLRERVAALGW